MFIFSDDRTLALNSEHIHFFSFGYNEKNNIWEIDACFINPITNKPSRILVAKQINQQGCIQWINAINNKLRKEKDGSSK
jgi:hypothetical protein